MDEQHLETRFPVRRNIFIYFSLGSHMKLCLVFSLLSTACFASVAGPPKAQLLYGPHPTKTLKASSRHLAGTGVFLLQMDMASGRVISITIQKSTGQPLLDKCAVDALRKWRTAPGTVRTIRLPVIFTAYDDVARY